MTMTSHPHESPILSILFCEFHATRGPTIVHQVPEDFISQDKFKSLAAYIIPKHELEGRLITVNSLGHKVIGFPIGIDDPKFHRNRYIFNLCFVCEASKRTVQYEPLIKKLAKYMIQLELECQFLTKDENKEMVTSVLTDIMNQLNETRSCKLTISNYLNTSSTTIHLNVLRVHPDPRPVMDYEVPILTGSSIIPGQWDLTTQQVLPYIDGYRHVSKIALEADIEVSLVKACLQNMIYYGIINLIPIFQYTNIYMTTPLLVNLTKEPLRSECLRYVSCKESTPPSFKSVFAMFAAMKPGVTVKDICSQYSPSNIGIDEKKLVRFGLIKGILRRLQKYPVFVTTDPSSVYHQRGVYRYFDGTNSYDEICVETCKHFQELDEKVEKHPSVVIIWK